jgi:hypothetical protein
MPAKAPRTIFFNILIGDDVEGSLPLRKHAVGDDRPSI